MMSVNRNDYFKHYRKVNKDKLTAYNKQYRHKNRDKVCQWNRTNHLKYLKIIDNLKLNGCAICGYGNCSAALDFHHVKPSIKVFNINHYTIQRKHSNEEIAEELSKCILVCRNCHAEIHYGNIEGGEDDMS